MITQTSFVTVTCDQCKKSVTFPADKEGQEEAVHDNPWLEANRTVVTWDQRKLSYCSDVCLITAAGTGVLNKLEEKKVQAATSDAEINMAAIASERARQATERLKAGAGVSLS